jgi:hypothetical protein
MRTTTAEETHERPGDAACSRPRAPRSAPLAFAQSRRARLASFTSQSLSVDEFLQKHYRELSPDELRRTVLARLEAETEANTASDVTSRTSGPQEGVQFGYALNLSRSASAVASASRRATSRTTTTARPTSYIRVFEMEQGSIDFEQGTPTYDHPVPQPGQVLYAGAMPAVRQPAVRRGLPGRGDLEGKAMASSSSTTTGASAAATARPRARITRAASTGKRPRSPRKRSTPIRLPLEPHSPAGRDGEVHLLPPSHA